ncbi:hypothetical protein ABL78_2218 [Leptomonas seymouri]|uniref:Uncharacterized protein n=1 Tax=Leptomonas seymouri TaxID=5684 RepID=A0A0N1PCJ5_LEPSE|nr:hypothetical protein ABL78_2218 [Leptomonas seymouri]|eukprot:KPI88680.1 hypothetical protein ABL78_2218 [Leptomonas seymouri]
MSMQLFSFGHPCEHQLHRACIGGSNCPLNGYPDTWCCSFIKGKINFKRDRPCEGPRCHWDFVHPTQSQFDEVTQVIEQSRPIAAKLDEANDTDLLSFQISNPHIIDTVQCALHMMRHPPSTCARRVGQLLAYAAVLAGEQDVFVQLLKTMKKPVDGYILGAYAYLTQSKPSGAAGGGEKVAANQKTNKKQSKKKESKDDISVTLANIMVELMNAALSLGGQLVDREDQHVLQAMLIKALSTYPKSDKRHQEMLEKAVAKFGHRRLDDEEEAAAKREAARRETAAAVATAPVAEYSKNTAETSGATTAATTTAATAIADSGEVSGAPPAAKAAPAAVGGTSAAAKAPSTSAGAAAPTTPATATATTATATAPVNSSASPAGNATEPPHAVAPAAAAVPMPSKVFADVESKALPPPAPLSAEWRTPRETRDETSARATPSLASATTPGVDFSSAPGTPGIAAAMAASMGPFNAPLVFSAAASSLPSTQPTLMQASPLPIATTQASAGAALAAVTTPLLSAAAARPPSQPSAVPAAGSTATTTTTAAAAAVGPIVGISKVASALRMYPDRYDKSTLWSAPDKVGPGPNLYLCGGQFSVKSQLWGSTPLGEAARQPAVDAATKRLVKYITSLRELNARETMRVAEGDSESLLPPLTGFEFNRSWDDSSDSWALDTPEWEESSDSLGE